MLQSIVIASCAPNLPLRVPKYSRDAHLFSGSCKSEAGLKDLEKSIIFCLQLQEKEQPSASSWVPPAPVLGLRIRGWDEQFHLMVKAWNDCQENRALLPATPSGWPQASQLTSLCHVFLIREIACFPLKSSLGCC